MIIDSPIISGSYAASGSLNQVGNVVISGSLTVTGSIIGTASFAETASYLSGYVSPFPFTGSAIISGSLDVTGSLKVTGSITSTGTITAQTLVVQTVSSSVIYSSGSNVFGNDLANTQVLTGSVTITGSLAVNGSNAILTNQTSSMSASYAVSASYALNSTSASFATTSSFSLNVPVTASFANTATSSSFATTASFSLNVPVTSSYANNATSASFATTASYLTGYISPFPFTGSAIVSGSLEITGSAAISNLQGTGVRYLVADSSGSITAQSASAALKSTEAFTSTAGQTTFSVTNGYSTGYVDVFINGSKLSTAEFTDTSGTNIVLATGSFSGDVVEVVKYTPALGVTNNVLRQLTTLTGSAGQTVFSASYTPGLLDIFYNGSRLSPADFTANNGTFFTLATGSAANDILDVLVYSYQVGAFSGIGGVGTAAQVAYFDTTNSITGSPNFTISGSTMTVTGSLIVSGSGTFTNIGPAVMSGSLNISGSLTVGGSNVVLSNQTSSLNVSTASFAATASSADNLLVRNTLTAQTLVVQTITSSIVYSSGSNIFGNAIGNTQTFTGSLLVTGSSTITGIQQASVFLTSGSSTISGLGPSDWSTLGRGTNGSSILINDIAGANYAISTGGYNLSFYKHVSGSNTFSLFMQAVASGANDAAPYLSLSSSLSTAGVTFKTNNTLQSSQSTITKHSVVGLTMRGVTADVFDWSLYSAGGTALITNPTGTNNINFNSGQVWFSGGNVGINTSTTDQKLVINQGATGTGQGIPATTGTTQNGMLRLRPAIGVYGETLDFGMNVSTTYGWIQATNASSLGTNYNLALNPNGGKIGIGTSIPSAQFSMNNQIAYDSNPPSSYAATNGVNGQNFLNGYYAFNSDGYGAYPRYFDIVAVGSPDGSNGGSNIRFFTNPIANSSPAVERVRITSGGIVSIGNLSPNSSYALGVKYSTSTIRNGLDLINGYEVTSTAGVVVSCYNSVSGVVTTQILGNGGFANYTANNTPLSDQRLKKDITPLGSVWNKVKGIEIVNYKFKHESYDEFNTGVIAQQVEEVAPELVNPEGWGTLAEDGTPYKGIWETDIYYYSIKALQEAMAKIEILEEKLERNNII